MGVWLSSKGTRLSKGSFLRKLRLKNFGITMKP